MDSVVHTPGDPRDRERRANAADHATDRRVSEPRHEAAYIARGVVRRSQLPCPGHESGEIRRLRRLHSIEDVAVGSETLPAHIRPGESEPGLCPGKELGERRALVEAKREEPLPLGDLEMQRLHLGQRVVERGSNLGVEPRTGAHEVGDDEG